MRSYFVPQANNISSSTSMQNFVQQEYRVGLLLRWLPRRYGAILLLVRLLLCRIRSLLCRIRRLPLLC
jgi:hypothetical protein